MNSKDVELFKIISNYLFSSHYEINKNVLDFDYYYRVGENNSIRGLLANSFSCVSDWMSDDLKKKWIQKKASIFRKNLSFQYEREIILNELNKKKIPYFLLKGVVVLNLYPDLSDREMSDNDIYFEPSRQKEVRDIFVSLGYEVEIYDKGCHDSYIKDPFYNFEMHRRLFNASENKILNEYYKDHLNQLLVKVDVNHFELRMNDDDFYIYLMAHFYKHYSMAGSGIKYLFDVALYNSKKKLNYEYIERVCEELGMKEFEKRIRSLSYKLMHNDFDLNENEKEMVDYLLSCGTYGNMRENVNKQLEKNSKVQYYWSRFFESEDKLRDYHPFFYRHKVLLPFLLVYRIVSGLIVHPQKLWNEFKYVVTYKNKK